MATISIKEMCYLHFLGSTKTALGAIDGISWWAANHEKNEASYSGDIKAKGTKRTITKIGLE